MKKNAGVSFLRSFKLKHYLIFSGVVIALAVAWLFYSKPLKGDPIRFQVNPAFSAYVSGYTAGVVSVETPVTIRLTRNVVDSSEWEQPVKESLFSFSPDIKGTAYWLDSRTVQFRPEKKLASGKHYQVKFKLSKLMEVTKGLETFEYGFETMFQNFDFTIDAMRPYDKRDLTKQKLTGTLLTADVASAEEVEKLLNASQDGNDLKISWTHDADKKTHPFVIEQVARKEKADEVKIKWDGDVMDVDNSGSMEFEIPAIGDFKLMSFKVIQSPEQYVSLQFSDPIKEDQDLDGLIRINGLYDLRHLLIDNEVRVFPQVRQTGEKNLTVEEGVLNLASKKLGKSISETVVFEQMKPAVRLVGKGVILPSTDGLVFPFEAVGLKAVDVKIIRVFEDNIPQFLQVNTIEGENELVRVGRPVALKTVQLTSSGITDLTKWNRYTLDLSQMINSEPGAIYQISIGFKKEHAAYFCDSNQDPGDETMASIEDENWDESNQSENSNWDYYDEYYYGDDYDYSQRENPCHSSYYGGRRSVKRNILASDLGIIAKRGNKGKLFVAVTDLKTTQPKSGVTLEVLDYQQRVLNKATTDGKGIASIDVDRKPFLLVAKSEHQRGYLKLDDGSSLSLSNFDISGEPVQEGIKGFIYGERDVWRPGDTLFLSFILEDKDKILPEAHPVIFELIDPQGKSDQKIIKAGSIHGFYSFMTKTSDDAPTGNWTARVKVGGATFTKNIKVETIKPNRLKINLDFKTDKLTADKNSVRGNLNVKWLHGATARNLKAEFDVIMTPAKTEFPKFKDYVFDDPAKSYSSESESIYEGYLDNEGNAVVSAQLDADNSPGMLMAHFRGKVFEEGGEFSVDRFSLPFYPYTSFVGIQTPPGDKARGMLLTDTDHNVRVVTVDADGSPVSGNEVQMEVYKLEWKWWWDQSEDYLSNYVGRSYSEPIANGVISTSNGTGNWSFKITYPDWGRYLVRACDQSSGHCTGKIVYVDWPGWAGRADRDMPGGASMLSFSTDKAKYQVGEDVKINIPGSGEGRALVSIENGSKVVESHWVETKKGETAFAFEVTKDMAPNVFVHVTLLQPHSQTINDLPIRLYGVVPVLIDDKETHLEPVITLPEVITPEGNVSIKVSEKDNKAMAYTVAMVDEGLLDITRFKTPDPWKSFYAREALGVKTWDMYDFVVGAYGGQLERLLSIGGDDEAKPQDEAKTNRFKPVVKYFGPFYLEKGKTNTHSFKMPQYVGSVRTMVIAGYEGAYGFAEKATPVRQPLMLLATLPRVLGPEEEVKLPVTVFAMDNSVKNVQVTVKTNNMFEAQGSLTQTISFDKSGDKIVNFDLKVRPRIGKGTVTVTAVSGSKKAQYDIELEVRNPNPQVTDVKDFLLEGGKTWNISYNPVGMTGTNTGVIEISSIPPINLEKRMKYLLAYPHGCIEQTVSTVFPQLYLSEVKELVEKEKEVIQTNVKAGIDRLKSFQNAEGGFSYWPGSPEFSEWGTNYAGHFMIEASQKGYAVPDGMVNKWKGFQKKMAQAWKKNKGYALDDLIQAYRLYTLALAKSPDMGSMNRLREHPGLTVQAKWRLAAAYVLAGQPEAAKELVNDLGTAVEQYRELAWSYGSSERDEAMILETLSLLNNRTKGIDLVKKISAELSDNNRWMSTQTTAYCLLAISKFSGKEGAGNKIDFNYQINNEKSARATSELPVVQKAIPADAAGKISIKNNGQGILYARLIMHGTPVAGDQTASENDLRMDVIYKTMTGEVIDPSSLTQGTDFMAEVTISNPGLRGDYEQMALTQIFPSGWEIHNTRLDETEEFFQKDKPEYQDIRDDRVYTYFDLPANKRVTYRILLNSSYLGTFYLPTIYCEAMYDNSISARKPGKYVKVVKPGGI